MVVVDERRSSWSQAAGWAALAAAGQMALLALIDAGPDLHYQHYLPVERAVSVRPWASAVLACQMLAVVVAMATGGWRRLRPLLPVGGWRALVVVALSVTFAAAVSADVRRYVAEETFAAALQLVQLATLLLAAASLPDQALRRIEDQSVRLFGSKSSTLAPGKRDRFGLVLGVCAFFVAAALALFSYERHPHVPDEVTYVTHAKYLADGRLTMPAPPVRQAFDVDLFIYEADRWYSSVPPGWPAVLAVGTMLGVPWLVNPLLTAVAIVLAYALFVDLYGRRTARFATVLLAASPWLLFVGMSYMTQTLSLVAVVAVALGLTRASRTGSLAWSAAAGLALGAASVIRPLDGAVLGLVAATWALGFGFGRLRLPALVVFGVATAAVASVGLAYNGVLTGHPLRFPVTAFFDQTYWPGSNDYGFGPNRGIGWGLDPNPGHSPFDGLVNAQLNTFSLNTDLFGWGAGSLWLAALALVGGRLRRVDWAVVWLGAAVVGAYFFYWYSGGPDFGARYWFPIIVPLVAMSARGFEVFERQAGPRALGAVGLAIVLTLTMYLPWRAVDKYFHFRGMQGGAARLASTEGLEGALVLVRGRRFPDYASAVVLNPPDLRSRATIYAWDQSADVRARVLAAYADRPVWILDGPTVTGAGYRLSPGPIDRQALPPVQEFAR